MQWQNLWVEAQVQFKHPRKMVVLLTSQDKIRWKTPFGIEYTKRYFILQNKHQSVKGQLRGDFGYLSNTPATSQILSGTYNYPPGCDPETQELLQKFELIRCIVPKDAVPYTFQNKSWQNRWVMSKEKTSSSE